MFGGSAFAHDSGRVIDSAPISPCAYFLINSEIATVNVTGGVCSSSSIADWRECMVCPFARAVTHAEKRYALQCRVPEIPASPQVA